MCLIISIIAEDYSLTIVRIAYKICFKCHVDRMCCPEIPMQFDDTFRASIQIKFINIIAWSCINCNDAVFETPVKALNRPILQWTMDMELCNIMVITGTG